MDPRTIDDLCQRLNRQIGYDDTSPTREPIRVWSMSGVERLRYPDGTTTIFKYAAEPFTGEDEALQIATDHGIPVPAVHAATVQHRTLGMIITDLGEPTAEATDADGIVAAVRLHQAGLAPKLPVLDQAAFAELPELAQRHLAVLYESGRWTDAHDLESMLDLLHDVAPFRVVGTDLQPFGFCHSEFHPTSLHIAKDGWHLLDFARAFNGPGLIDLASWPGTTADPDLARVRGLIEQYVRAGGHPDALTSRGGLAAERWALGWHRVWIVEWFMEQAVRWVNDPTTDPAYVTAVRRHLREAVDLLHV